MIERFFFEGATYAWNPPGAVANVPKDGTIVASAVTASAMSFQDLDPYLFDTNQVNKFRGLGLTKNQAIQHDWLNYIEGRTATINSTNDVLTGFMSGCIIVIFNDGMGVRQVGHIGTISAFPKDQPPNTTVKRAFAAAMPGFTNVKGYNPFAAWGPEIAQLAGKFKNPVWNGWWKVLSLITSDGRFFSILLLKHNSNDAKIICGGIKSCTAMGPNLLQQTLQ